MINKKPNLREIEKTIAKNPQGVFSENTRVNLKNLSNQLEALKDLENTPFQDFLKFFPSAFAMIGQDLKYLLHSSKWVKVLETSQEDLSGSALEFSGFHVADISLEMYRKALTGSYHADSGKDVFLTRKKRRIHIHWMVWKKENQKAILLLIADLNSYPGNDSFHS